MVLDTAPLMWLDSLQPNSIFIWNDLKKAFIDNFQGSMSRAATRHDLSLCRHERNEPIQSYLKCFFDIRGTIPNISDEDIIDCFHNGISTQLLDHDFRRDRPTTVVQLREMMQLWANQEEQEHNRFPRRDFDNNGRRNSDCS